MKIFALSRNPVPYAGIETISADITKELNLSLKADFIIHAATPVVKANPDYHQMMNVIVNGTENILNFAEKSQAQKILVISSGAVYGEQAQNVSHLKENDQHSGRFYDEKSAYGTGKRISELMATNWAKKQNVDVTIARCFAFSGPHLAIDEHFAIGNFVRDGIKNQTIEIKSDGMALRSYMDAHDLVIWLMTILLKGKSGEAYNVGSDQEISIKDLATKVAGFFPGLNVVVHGKYNPEVGRNRYVPSIEKAKTQLGLKLTINLDESIQRMIDFNQRNS